MPPRAALCIRVVLRPIVVTMSWRSLPLAGLLLMCGCATGAIPRPFPQPGPAIRTNPPLPPSPSPGASPDGYAIAGTALSLRGSPYRSGGSDPSGFDCSGFVQFVFARHGFSIARDVREQFRSGKEIAPDQIEPGDLLFFSTVSRGASHVAIAIGGAQFIHAPNSTGSVRVESLTSTYWGARYIAARRLTAKS